MKRPSRPSLQEMLDLAALAATPVPVVGDVAGLAADGYRFATDPSSRTLGNAAWASLGMLPFVPAMGGMTKAYHATFDDFDKFDFSKVGSFTKWNATDTDPNSWAMRLARLGAWFSRDDLSAAMAAPIVKEADLVGDAREFDSLDELADYIEGAGGAIKARKALRAEGYDLAKVNDEEFGTTSYVALHPRAIEGLKTKP